ncbi:oligoribonuclease [Sporosarcina sp. ITBMC105]
MSNENIKAQKVTAEDVAKAVSNEALYTREEIQALPSAFGVTPEVLAGSLALVEGTELTRTQVKSAIDKFKNREV